MQRFQQYFCDKSEFGIEDWARAYGTAKTPAFYLRHYFCYLDRFSHNKTSKNAPRKF